MILLRLFHIYLVIFLTITYYYYTKPNDDSELYDYTSNSGLKDVGVFYPRIYNSTNPTATLVTGYTDEYEYAGYTTAAFTITQADLEISIPANQVKTYNGGEQSILFYLYIDGKQITYDSTKAIFEYDNGTIKTTTHPKNAGSYTVKITIPEERNFKSISDTGSLIINKATPTVTFPTLSGITQGQQASNSGGSATGVDNQTLPARFVYDTTKIQYSGNAETYTTTVNVTYQAPNSNYTSVSKDISVTLYAVAYIGNTYYATIHDALAAAINNTVYVVPGLYSTYEITIDISTNITITSGNTLIVPYYEKEYVVTGNAIKNLATNTYGDSNQSNVKKNRSTLIKMTSGADIIIESGGSLYLGGESRNIGITGRYTEIGLNEGSKIDCSGNFYCFGYVKEINAKNGNQSNYKEWYNNDYDQDRLIHVNSGGLFYTTACFYDVTDVMTMKNLNDNKIFPLSVFDFSSVQTYLQIDAGAQFKAKTFIYQLKTDEEIVVNEDINIISDTGSALFNLSSGNISIEYCPTNEMFTNSTDITRFYLNGELSIGYISFTMTIKGIPANISTENVFLPMSYKFNLFINDSGEFTMDYKIKFLPGSSLQINGGTLNINSEVIFYTSEYGTYVDRYPTKYDDARLINNGNLTIKSNGKLGAFIETQAIDNSAIIDLTNVTDSTQLTVTTIEGEGKNTVSVTSSGFFVDSSENGKSIYQFVAGSVVNSANNNEQCWDGNKFTLMNLQVVITATDYKYNIYDYEVYVASDQSGSDKTLVTFDSTGCTEVPFGKFVNIIVTRSKSATLNGVDINASTWYEVTSNMEIVITPNKGRKVHVYTKADSGNSDTTFKVSEKDPNGNEIVLYDVTGGLNDSGIDLYIVDGWQVKATCSMGLAGSVGASTEPDTDNFKLTVYDDNGNVISESKYTQSYITVNNDCSIYFPRKAKSESGSCLVEGTLITMFDGTKKKVEEIKAGDSLLVFNHETGQYDIAEVLFNDMEPINNYIVINLEFSNGSIIKVVSEHGFFNLDLMKYVYITEDNYINYIGHRFVSTEVINGEVVQGVVTLDAAYVTKDYVRVYSPVTKYHLNYITENVLSMPGGINGLFNIFEYDYTLKYNEDLMQKDIEEYGLFTYEDFKDLVSEDIYNSFPTQYFKIAIGKGLLTWDELYYYIERYAPLM